MYLNYQARDWVGRVRILPLPKGKGQEGLPKWKKVYFLNVMHTWGTTQLMVEGDFISHASRMNGDKLTRAIIQEYLDQTEERKTKLLKIDYCGFYDPFNLIEQMSGVDHSFSNDAEDDLVTMLKQIAAPNQNTLPK